MDGIRQLLKVWVTFNSCVQIVLVCFFALRHGKIRQFATYVVPNTPCSILATAWAASCQPWGRLRLSCAPYDFVWLDFARQTLYCTNTSTKSLCNDLTLWRHPSSEVLLPIKAQEETTNFSHGRIRAWVMNEFRYCNYIILVFLVHVYYVYV